MYIYIYIFTRKHTRGVQNDFELNKFSSCVRAAEIPRALIALYIIAALPYLPLICANESYDLSRTQIQRFDKQIDTFGRLVSRRADDKRSPNGARTRGGEKGRSAFFFD